MNTNRQGKQSHMADEKKNFCNKNERKIAKTKTVDTQLVVKKEWNHVFLKSESSLNF